jgi:hypothetical protein
VGASLNTGSSLRAEAELVMSRMATTLIVPVVLLAALSAGCGPSSPRTSPGSTGQPAATAASAESAPCARWSCRPGNPIPLGSGFSVRLWLSPTPDGTDSTSLSRTPVVELLHDSLHVQWWIATMGFAWAANLTCLASEPEPNCVVTSSEGAHAGSAEMVLLRSGALVSPARTRVVFDSGAPYAGDLDGDGYLDVLGSDNDYLPNYATGHNFWATYRFHADALTETGCAPRPSGPEPQPDHLLFGPCPSRPGGNE